MQTQTRIIIYGTHSEDWMLALNSSAPVWKDLSSVTEVLHVEGERDEVPAQADPDLRTVIIPLMEDHIANCPPQFDRLIPSIHALQTLRDKGVFARYVDSQQLGNHCPKIFRKREDIIYPCVIKRTDLNAGNGVEIAKTERELDGLLSSEVLAGKPVVLQAFVAGRTEYVLHLVCRNGRILWHCCYAYEVDPLTIRRAGYATRKVMASLSQLRQLEAFLLPLGYSGPCNADCKLDAEGRLIVLEINPRLGGSLMRPDNRTDLYEALVTIISAASPL